MFIEQRQPRDQDRSLQKGREAKPHDLLAPLVESVQISARDAEHIQTSNCHLNKQNAAALDVLEELNESTRLVIYPCIHTVLLGDDIRELLATFSEEDQIGDEAAIQSTLEDMPE